MTKKEIEEKFGKILNDLIYGVTLDDGELTLRDNNPDRTFQSGGQKSKEYYKILEALAYIRLKFKNFGGRERTLHAQVIEEFKNREAVVTNIKVVKTGTYHPASHNWGSLEVDYEPAYLTNAKTHKLLEVEIFGVRSEDFREWLGCYKIEAKNVEKIPSVMETYIEYEHRIKQLEKANNG